MKNEPKNEPAKSDHPLAVDEDGTGQPPTHAASQDVKPIDSADKDPDVELRYEVDWSEWLAEGGVSEDSIVTYVVNPGTGSTLLVPNSAHDGEKVIFWAQNGVPGTTYEVVVEVVTATSRVGKRSVAVHVTDNDQHRDEAPVESNRKAPNAGPSDAKAKGK